MQKTTRPTLIKTTIFGAIFSLSMAFLPQMAIARPHGGNVLLEHGSGREYAAAITGSYAQALGDPIMAARAYERAWERNKSDEIMFSRMVQSYLIAGDLDNAIRVSRAVDAGFLTSEGKMVLAADALIAGRNAEVNSLLAQINLPSVRALYARQLQAWALVMDRKKDEAIALAARSSGNRAVDRNANYSRALLYQYLGDENGALTAFTTAYDAGARASIGVVAYARFLNSHRQKDKALEILTQAGPESDAPQWLAEVRGEIQNQRRAPRATRGNAGNFKSFVGQSLGAVALGIVSDPRLGSPLGELAIAGRFDNSLSALDFQSSRILYAIGNETAAIAKLSQIPPNSAMGDVANSLRSSIVFEDDKVQGEQIALAAASARPNITNRFNLAVIYLGEKKYAEAKTIFDAMIAEIGNKGAAEIGVEPWVIYNGRAHALIELDKADEAIADIRHAMTLNPENPQLLNALGYTLADNNRNLDEALGYLNEALRLSPRSGDITDSLGWVLYRLGRFSEAVDKLEAAVALSPSNGVVIEHLGDVYWRTNRQVEARLEWQKAATTFEDADDKARVTAKVANGLPALPTSANIQTN